MTHIPEIKGAVIERFNNSLKNGMYKYVTNIQHTSLLVRHKKTVKSLQQLCAFHIRYASEQNNPLKHLRCLAKNKWHVG